MNYEESIKLLTSQGKFYIDLGLDRVSKVLEIFGNPQDKLKCIQVAGTNGKGSVCAMLDSILREAGYKTGLYTSPHIFEYTERIKVDSEEISRLDFSRYVEKVVEVSEGANIHLTEFEILTVVMFNYFADKGIDIGIIETGLGGRLDATNVLKENICAVITHIDYDHTERLGNTKDKIAYEKSGIIKPNSAVITSEGYEVIKDRADEMNALFALATPYVPPYIAEALTLVGQHQLENLALVLEVLELKFRDIDEKAIVEGLKKVQHHYRFEYIEDKNMIIDVAHNPNCFQALMSNLNTYYPEVYKQYVFGCLKNKDYEKMVSYLADDEMTKDIFVYEFGNKNACTFEDISKVTTFPVRLVKSLSDIRFSDDVLTVVCGSFYMLKELLEK
jgi:dihydrofolate synthase/folylpolyglutamate synthase